MAGQLTLTCLRPAAEARIVDQGRPGRRAEGIPGGGPADPRAARAANRLLNQPAATPCLELAGSGGHWLLSGRGQLVLTGADMNVRLNGRLLDYYSVNYLDGDYLLTTTPARRGCRLYLALRGEWALPRVLGSAELGLPGISPVLPGWSVDVRWQREAPFANDLETYRHRPVAPLTVAAVPGPEWPKLPETVRHWLLTSLFAVGRQSNRQGLRLENTQSPTLPEFPMLSSPVLPGTVQLSPAGPLLLGPDAQTLGGYPRALLLTDGEALAAAYQLRSGEELRFLIAQAPKGLPPSTT